MPLARDTVSNFIGGISQQTDKLMFPNQSKVLENNLLDPIEGLKKRPPTEHIAKISEKLSFQPYVHTIVKEDETYQVLLDGRDIKVVDLQGNKKDVVVYGNSYDYITSNTPLDDFYMISIADYTFILNKKIKTKLDTTKFPNNHQSTAIIFVKQGDYGVDYKIRVNGEEVASKTADKTDASKIKTSYIASDLLSDLNSNLDTTKWEINNLGSTITITNLLGEPFQIQTVDGNGNRNLFAFYNETSCSNDLPVVAPNGFILKIIGDKISVADDYYVQFKTADGSNFGTGAWIECCQPNIQYKIDSETMPHALIREADGVFSLKKLDWTERKSGDEDTSPTPSFIGNTIQEVLTYKGRLGFISGDRQCYSDVEDIFSFFKRSVLTELDTDPIDVGSNSKMTLMKHSLPFNEGLMLFSETSQFNLKGGDVFTNATVSLDLVTEYQCSKHCKPILLGANGYFTFENGSYTRVMSVYVTQSYTLDAIDITEQVPSYIPANVYKLAGSSANHVLLALTKNEPNSIYVYNFYYNGEQKVQSAWHKWAFSGKVLNVDFDKHIVYLTIEYEDGIYLEKIDLTPRLAEEGLNYIFYLDRKIYTTNLIHQEDTTMFTLPYPVQDKESLCVVDIDGFPKTFTIEEDNQTITVRGIHNKLIVGNVYKTLWQLPHIYMRTNTSQGATKVKEGMLMIRDVNITYANTGFFRVKVVPKYTTQIESEFVFTGMITGLDSATLGKIPIESGTFLVPIIARNEEIEIIIENDSYLPNCFLSMEWLGDFTYRGR